MGNTNTTPLKHAIQSHKSFFTEFNKDKSLNFTVAEHARQSNLFIEDLLVNDDVFNNFSEKEQCQFLGMLCYSFGYFSPELVDAPVIGEIAALMEFYYNDTSPKDLLETFMTRKYKWDGNNFTVCSTGLWETCSVDDLNCDDFTLRYPIDSKPFVYDVKDDRITKGLAMVTEYCDSVRKYLSTFKGSDDWKHCVEAIKETTIDFNRAHNKIPCYSGVVKLNKGILRRYRPADKFTTKLDYDPTAVITDVVGNYIVNLPCDGEHIATVILSAAALTKPTLTIISGPPKSGKSTLVQVIRELYGQFACTSDEYESGNFDKSLVRTCVYDNAKILVDEDMAKNHPIKHIIVACQCKFIPEKYGDRIVNYINLRETIPEDDRVEGITRKLSTRKQKGSLLGWCAGNADSTIFSEPTFSNQLDALLGLMKNLPVPEEVKEESKEEVKEESKEEVKEEEENKEGKEEVPEDNNNN